MKRRDLLRALREHAGTLGVEMIEIEGGSHTKIQIGDRRTVIPRHNEVNERTAKRILKQMGVDQ